MTKTASFVFELKSIGPDDFMIESVTQTGTAHPGFNPAHLTLDLKEDTSEQEADALAQLLSKCVGGFHFTL